MMLAGTAVLMTSHARQLTMEESLARYQATPAGMHRVHQRATQQPVQYSLAYTAESSVGKSLYVVNTGNEGFVVLSADDVAPEVLGYADGGAFDAAIAPAPFLYWLQCMQQDVETAIVSGQPMYSSVRRAKERTTVEPLMETLWAQGAPYNDLTPTVNRRSTEAGCVAIAMGQVMYTHRWPLQGKGRHSYLNNANNETQSANFATTYQWDLIQKGYGSVSMGGVLYDTTIDASNFDARGAVSKLVYHCGVSVDMQYDTTGSASDLQNAVYALMEYFDYDRGAKINSRICYTDEAWEDLVYAELSAGRPVIYGGAASISQAHAFVLDGYKDGLYHVNWGWAGIENGYFALTGSKVLHPSINERGYQMSQRCLTGVKPSEEGSHLALNFLYVGSALEIQNSQNLAVHSAQSGDALHFVATSSVSTPVCNNTPYTCKGYFGARFEDATTGAVYYTAKDATLRSLVKDELYPGNYDITTAGVPTGLYKVSLAVYSEEGEWHDVGMPTAVELPQLAVTQDLTGIAATSVAPVQKAQCHDLQGRKVGTNQRGIYVEDHKKLLK